MAKNTYLSKLNLKNKLNQQEQRQNYRYNDCFDGCQMEGPCGEMHEEVRGLRSTNR